MEFYEAVDRRRTQRDFLPDASLPQDALERILSAGMKAPSNDHMRDWRFVVITDKAVAARCLQKIPVRVTQAEIDYVIRERIHYNRW